MGYKKRPTKGELYEQIEALERQNQKMSEELEQERRRKWELRIPEANELMCEFLNKTFPRTWCKLRFEHVDSVAYWYTFELVNDDCRQTWSVRHSDLENRNVAD